jgi:hypothetical protein
VAIVQPEGLGQVKNTMTSSGIEPATFDFSIVPQQTTLPRVPAKVRQIVCVMFVSCTRIKHSGASRRNRVHASYNLLCWRDLNAICE